MEILLGLGLSLPLVIYTFIFWYLTKTIIKEQPFLNVGLMIMGDIIICGIYYLIGLEFVESESLFSKGIGLSFMLSTFIRVLLFLVESYKLEGIDRLNK